MIRRLLLPPPAFLLTIFSLAATTQAAVDPALLNLAPPEAKVLYGIQVQATLASPFGQFALSHLPTNAVTRFAAATGFEVQRDLQEVVVASSSSDGSDVLILARGTFPSDKFIALASVSGAAVYDCGNDRDETRNGERQWSNVRTSFQMAYPSESSRATYSIPRL